VVFESREASDIGITRPQSRAKLAKQGSEGRTMFNLGKTKSLVGLDIGSSSVKAVELKKTKNGYELASFGLEALAQDTVVDGAIMDAPSVAEKIISIFDSQKTKVKDVATSVSGHSVIV
jgi:type IV pilus assembly protein PilM